jgi:polar amino acid transport system substrate-binding protein
MVAPAARIALCADVWCPYNCDPGSDRPGFAVEIARAVFGPAGYAVDYQEMSWARCVEDARAGRFAGIIGAIRKDAPDFTFPSLPVGVSGDAYAVRAGDPFHFDGERSLDGRVLGVVRDYNFSGLVGAYIAAHHDDGSRVEFVSGSGALAKNLAKLMIDRVDVVLDDENVLLTAIDQMKLSGRVRLERGPNVTPVFIAFSPREPQRARLAALLDSGIAALQASGGLAQIMARYHVAHEP